ncbi:MAG: NADH-quinone oxidoreductase subunit N [Actinomycetota bacterium]|nr:NADH-quinone oxidoreductase subunit N [Actinomycetota bacterium]
MPQVDYHAIAPEIILGGTIMVVLVADLFLRPERKWFSMVLAFLGTLGALAVALTLIGETRSSFGGTYVVDAFAVLFKVFFLVAALAVLLLSLRYFREGRYYQGEYYFLLLSAFLGMLTISSSRDLLMLFISLELVTAPAWLMAGFRKRDPRSNEAALKFFLIGILSTAVMLYGMSLIYGVTGSLRLVDIARELAGPAQGIAIAAVLFVVTGFAFKVSSVPFHFWAPDTYEGSPIPVAAFLSVASKAAGFAGLLQIMFLGFRPLAEYWAPVFAVLSILTMTLGNLIALQQRQVVRLLAYSSVAQAGYMLLPFALIASGSGEAALATNERAFAAAVLYILIYGVMNLGAFGVVVALAREAPGALISDFAGLWRSSRAPWLAVAMAAFMISLGGVPPLAGFWGKFFIFGAAVEADQAWLAVVMVVNSVVSLYYYVAIVRQMFLVEVPALRPLRAPLGVTAVVALAAVTVVAVGIVPDLLARFPQGATLP